MVAEVIAGLGALKTAFDLAKGLKDISDATNRNAAVIELQEKILTAQQAQATLVERITELEKKVAGFEAWEAQKQRYQLKDFGGSTFAYELKESEARGEPIHRACAKCFQQSRLSILQFKARDVFHRDLYNCPECKNEYHFGERVERELRTNWSPRSR